MKGTVYPPEKQGRGTLDRGRMTESKPIGLSGEGSAVIRVGPLFYWSWFHSPLEAYIGLHPHQGFEIITYMIQGKVSHADSLGIKSEVEAGGLQLMRTGSGIQHEERFIGPNVEGFQIWFEPLLRDSLKQNPSYRRYHHHDFHMEREEGIVRKTVIGDRSPADLSVDVHMYDVHLKEGKSISYKLKKGRALAALAVRGQGTWGGQSEGDELSFHHKDFVLLCSDHDELLRLEASDTLRMILIDVPDDPGYPLYPKKP
ncbi:pirin family protein [Paenibacillus faecalis]|uniref:pirin family protein n=1 Tax=Paenibacillus faecalis TaxID=2079532 RepID=UPI000D0FAC01|nr:pirin family protein [Paenibacillus faecalis]